ncbi:MAG: cytochrome P450 [Solirubrobacteraceae bacterium]
MSVATYARSDLDLFSDEVMLDPYPHLTDLREGAAVVYMETSNLWALTRYEHNRAAMANWKVFSSRSVAFNDTMNEILVGTSLATDPPDHRALRKVLMERLSPRALRDVEADIAAVADRMVAELVERGSFEAMDDLARALPLTVVADLIGVQGTVRENMLVWGEAAFNCLGPMNQRTVESFPIAGELFQWSVQCKAEDLTEGSLGRAIFAAAERGDIPYETCGMIIHQYVAAGMDSTITALGNAIYLLATHPDQFDLMRRDRSLIPAAFNEIMRYESPIHAFGRFVTEDFEIEGTVIPGGSQAVLLYGAANRDPRHYEDPDVFRIERDPGDHLSFGHGQHVCAGRGLAKLEIYAVLDALARRVRRLTIGEPTRRLGNSTRSYDKLPVVDIQPD